MDCNFAIEGITGEEVALTDQFPYLGLILDNNGEAEEDVVSKN